ncbi:hypothetical protein N0V87_005436 [Didymella glomerata]|uniref:NAD(P)-binding domain-containing protein n=1 Tax=Didymella glomerata TaxID=749621 RepID=A0A9W8WYP2_9PLEO|nr:hypothetical protein N0V87_005436 [Didymella glomerata]
MSAYATLGATGQVGGSILHILSENTDYKINVLVRSRSKLEHSYPPVVSNKNIHIFEGSVSDIPTLASCLKELRPAFLCVAVTENTPDVTISVDTTEAVTKAFQWLQSRNRAFKPPRLVVSSSASLDTKFWRTVPSFVHNVMYAANSHIYDNLARAETYLRQHEDWLNITQRNHDLGEHLMVSPPMTAMAIRSLHTKSLNMHVRYRSPSSRQYSRRGINKDARRY